jgi:hypothetical protein
MSQEISSLLLILGIFSVGFVSIGGLGDPGCCWFDRSDNGLRRSGNVAESLRRRLSIVARLEGLSISRYT